RRRFAAARELVGGCGAGGDRGKEVELDRCFQRSGTVKRGEGGEDLGGVRHRGDLVLRAHAVAPPTDIRRTYMCGRRCWPWGSRSTRRSDRATRRTRRITAASGERPTVRDVMRADGGAELLGRPPRRPIVVEDERVA